MPGEQRKKLGDLLLDAGFINRQQYEKALQLQKTQGKRLASIMIEEGMITEENMLTVLGQQLGLQYMDLRKTAIDPEAPGMISEILARKYAVIPIQKRDDNTLVVATNDPLNFLAADDIKNASGCNLAMVLETKENILKEIEKHYGRQNAERAIDDFSKQMEIVDIPANILADNAEIANAPVVRLVDSIIRQAITQRASDIHIEPFEEHLRVRFRLDGVLQEVLRPPKNAHAALVTRIKLIAGMEISEKRLPQDGRYEAVIDNFPVDLRISSLPTVYGEKIVMRVLERGNFTVTKEQLGFEGKNLELFQSIIRNPHGIVLISGPTGSGKTTTLYSVLNELNTVDKNIVTVEDPVEYRLDGISQVQVNTKSGLNFSDGLRSILRQDPDIVMIGEMRDSETAEIAIRSAITGHLVFSTIHTNDTPSTISRLLDMGMEPFFVATAVVGIVSQRLVRKICKDCIEAYEASDYEKRLLGIEGNEKTIIHRGRGCGVCGNTGYKGRIAIYEVMPITRNIRSLIIDKASVDDIRDEAIKVGMTTLNINARKLVLKSATTVDELARIAYNMEY